MNHTWFDLNFGPQYDRVSRPVLTRDTLNADWILVEREMYDKNLKDMGLRIVARCEQYRLFQSGRRDLADSVCSQDSESMFHTPRVLSFDDSGKEVEILVVSTSGDINTPFIILEADLGLSEPIQRERQIYRVFDIREGTRPRYYVIAGRLNEVLNRESLPTQYVAW